MCYSWALSWTEQPAMSTRSSSSSSSYTACNSITILEFTIIHKEV